MSRPVHDTAGTMASLRLTAYSSHWREHPLVPTYPASVRLPNKSLITICRASGRLIYDRHKLTLAPVKGAFFYWREHPLVPTYPASVRLPNKSLITICRASGRLIYDRHKLTLAPVKGSPLARASARAYLSGKRPLA